VLARPGIQAVCFGHTHLATDASVRVDDRDGWPLVGTGARYYNSGSWTRKLNLQDPCWTTASFADLCDRANYRAGRDLIRLRWPAGVAQPQVTMERWTG